MSVRTAREERGAGICYVSYNFAMATARKIELGELTERDDSPFLRQALCRVAGELGAQGWCQGTGGNFSLTLSHDPLRLLITRSGVDKRSLDEGDLLVVGPAGEPVPGEG